MNALVLLTELQLAGVIINASPDGCLDLDAPAGVLTPAWLEALSSLKPEIIKRLAGRCPICKTYGPWQTARSLDDGLYYYDSKCLACNEVIETCIPATLDHLVKAELAA